MALRNLWKAFRIRAGRRWGLPVARVSGLRLYGQGLEDLYLWRIFGRGSRGTYVDVGAGDGRFLSTTYSLYREGWRGICVEPNPESFSALRKNRPDDACEPVGIGRRRETRVLTWTPGVPEGSSFAAEGKHRNAHPVAVVPLADLLARHAVPREFELLSVDAEGMEGEVLGSMDWAKHRPRVVVVEYLSEGRAHPEGMELLWAQGYRPLMINRWNMFFSNRWDEDSVKMLRGQDWFGMDRIEL